MEKIYLLMLIENDYEQTRDLFNASRDKQRLYNKAEEFNNGHTYKIPIFENDENYNSNSLQYVQHFLIIEEELL